jgi:glycosyltransferase involved in cell wall biosynthesis
MNENKKVVFQKFRVIEKGHLYPYPPLCRQPDTDYICFTDDKRVTSNHWKVQYVERLDEDNISPYLNGYESKWELCQSQIQMGAFPKAVTDGDIINIPSLDSLPNTGFDLRNFIPTADSDGNYIYRKNPIYQGGKYNGRELLLSIGVPVSNQIDTIDRCLSHIKPLLDNLDSELIVVDTGSTDGTIEVCKSYGARILKYPWCDNMSAVRNEAVYNAKGEWYLSIDDDEWFENVDDILHFFLSGHYKDFDCATYIQRNYRNMEGNLYNDFHTIRMMRITPDVHFEGRIHDAIEFSEPVRLCATRSYVHHYGFANDSTGRLKRKFERNTPILMHDVYEYPENPRYLFQLADGYKGKGTWDIEIALYLQVTAMALEADNKELGAKCVSEIYVSLLDANDERLIKWSDFLRQLFPTNIVQKAANAYCLEVLSFKSEKTAIQILEYYNDYVSFRNEYMENRNNTLALASNVVALVEHEAYKVIADSIAFGNLIKVGDENRALEVLQDISLEDTDDFLNFVLLEGFTSSEEVYEALCGKITALQWEEWSKDVLSVCACNMSKADRYDTQAKRLPEILAKISVSSILDCLKGDKDDKAFEALIRYAMDFAVREGSLVNSSVQELCFCAIILKEAYVKKRQNNNAKDLLYRYIAVMGRFAEKYYNSDYLIEVSLNVIPPDIRAVYRMYVVLVDGRATKENVEILKQALGIFPSFHEEIRTVLKELR